MSDEIGRTPQEGDLAFPVEETETPTDSPTENNQDDTTGTVQDKKQEDNVPFHQHPRWKQREEEWNSKLDSLRTEYETKLTEKFKELTPKEQQSTSIPPWFGGDEKQWKDYQDYENSKITQAEERAYKRIKSEEEQQKAQVETANKYINDEVDRMKAEGKEFDRNELLKVVNDYRPVNDKGNWDFDKAYEILQLKKTSKTPPSTTEARKHITQLTDTNTKAETPPKDYSTGADFMRGGRPW